MSHFTAVLEIIEVKEILAGGPRVQNEKEKTEIARIIIRDHTLAGLRNKLAAHVALVEG